MLQYNTTNRKILQMNLTEADLKTFTEKSNALAKALKAFETTSKRDLSDQLDAAKTLLATIDAFDTATFAHTLKAHTASLENKAEQALKNRREAFLRLSREAGLPTKQGDQQDRCFVYTVRYKHGSPLIDLLLGNIKLGKINTYSGETLFKELKTRSTALTNSQFNRDTFLDDLDRAIAMYVSNHRSTNSLEFIKEGYARIRDLPEYIDFARATRKGKVSAPKGCTLEQLVYDLARLYEEGTESPTRRVETRQPAASVASEAVEIPNLKRPEELGRQALLIRVSRK